jgi:phage-related minor tail protein
MTTLVVVLVVVAVLAAVCIGLGIGWYKGKSSASDRAQGLLDAAAKEDADETHDDVQAARDTKPDGGVQQQRAALDAFARARHRWGPHD